jgi:pimeloyl-ACP methyl ester carboxylesterase
MRWIDMPGRNPTKVNWPAFIVAIVVVLVLGVTLYFVVSTQRIARQAERLVPPTGEFVEVDGARVHYVETGEGPPVVMIHGLGGQLHHMRRPLMEEFGDSYRLIAMDRPGSGYSTRPDGDGGIAEQALFIRRFIETLGLERPLLVGHSLGGAIALRTAIDHPDHVAGLALIAPLTQPMEEVPPEFAALDIGWPWLRWVVSQTIAIPMSVRAAPQTLDFVFGPQRPPEDFAVAGGAMPNLRPRHFYGTSTVFVATRADNQLRGAPYGEIDVPVGIIYGDADRVLDYDMHGRSTVGQIADLELEILAGVGHMVQYADTERTVEFIRRIAERAFAP